MCKNQRPDINFMRTHVAKHILKGERKDLSKLMELIKHNFGRPLSARNPFILKKLSSPATL